MLKKIPLLRRAVFKITTILTETVKRVPLVGPGLEIYLKVE